MFAPVVASSAVIRHVEELSLNAWPALDTLLYDGWLLRFSGGYTRRANSVIPLYPSLMEPAQKLSVCERAYRERGLPVVFKLTSAASEVDRLLDSRGYLEEGHTSVEVADLVDVKPPDPADVELLTRPSNEWVAAYCFLNRAARRHFVTMSQVLERISAPACFLSIRRDGETAAMGMAVVERGYVGLFDLVTRESLRNQGIGRQTVLHLLAWGRRQGARFAYLQVDHQNQPARHLYDRIGFRELYTYWYRARPGAAPGRTTVR